MTIETNDVGSSLFTMLWTLCAAIFGFIQTAAILDTIVAAIIGLLVGFYGNKLLKRIDNNLNRSIKDKEEA